MLRPVDELWRAALLSAALMGCGGQPPSPVEPAEERDLQTSERPERRSARREPPCPVTPPYTALKALSAALLPIEPVTNQRRSRGWGRPAVSVALTPRSGLIWWSAQAPSSGATQLPPPPELGPLRRYERCAERAEWRAEGGALWYDAWVTLRQRPPAERPLAERPPAERPELSTPASALLEPKVIELISACQPCPAPQVRSSLGSPLELSEAQTTALSAHLSLSEGERWIATRVRPKGLSLEALRSQTCLCR